MAFNHHTVKVASEEKEDTVGLAWPQAINICYNKTVCLFWSMHRKLSVKKISPITFSETQDSLVQTKYEFQWIRGFETMVDKGNFQNGDLMLVITKSEMVILAGVLRLRAALQLVRLHSSDKEDFD